jgi:predicted O-linked N-acetylglucosamine transferase (SPINDLY family)
MPRETAARRLHLAARRLAALDLAERGLKQRPDDPLCLAWRADLLRALDQPADVAGRRAASRRIDLAEACLDPFAETGEPILESAALYLAQFDPDIDDAHLVEAHRAWARRHAEGLPRYAPSARQRGRLRIGYVSADLGQHPVGRSLLGTLPAHDRDGFEVYVYSDRLVEDDLTTRLRASAEAWHRVAALDDQALAARIHDDEIDVLVDLAGHTWANRLLAFARKPAPIQLSFLGYGATTGMTAMDAVLSDPWEAPTAAHFTESVVRLASGRLPAPRTAARPLRSGPPVFGSLNKLVKLSPPVIALWARLLRQVPEARLLLQTHGLDQPWVRRLVVAAFSAHGIVEDRLDLRGALLEGAHLRTYAEIDVALDPLPFAGGVTTCDALSAGAPAVALAGARPLARQGLSVLARSGLEDLIAPDAGSYVAIAADAIGRALPSADPPAVQARELEAVYRQLWEKRRGSSPE